MNLSIKNTILLLALTCFAAVMQAQSYDINASVSTETSTCFTNGEIHVKFAGSDLGRLTATDRINFYVYKTGSSNVYRQHDLSFGEIHNGLFVLEGYPAGSYWLEYTIWAGAQEITGDTNDFDIGGDYLGLAAFQSLGSDTTLYGTRHTLNCKPTGRIQLEIVQGKFPYSVQIFKDGTLLRTEIFHSRVNDGDDPHAEDYRNYYNFEGLEKGNYTFVVTDVCGYQLRFDEAITIDYLNFQCVPDFVVKYGPISTTDNEIFFTLEGNFFNDRKYDDFPWQWLELRFMLEGGNWSSWQDFSYDVSDKVSSHQILYGKKYSFELRVKNCPTYPVCRSEIAIPALPDPPPCRINHAVAVLLKPVSVPVFCPCKGGKTSPDYKEYIIRLDYNICQSYKLPLAYYVKNLTNGNVLFDNYVLNTSAGSVVYEDFLNEDLYNNWLEIKLVDADGTYLIDEQKQIPEPVSVYVPPVPMVWSAKHNTKAIGCNNPTGDITLTLNCDSIPDGTVVELTHAPTGDRFRATYSNASNSWQVTGNPLEFSVISVSILCENGLMMRFADLFVYGTYEWRITNSSGSVTVQHTVPNDFRQYTVSQPLTFATKKNCQGTVYYPKVQIVSYPPGNPANSTQELTKFRVISGNSTGYEINGGTATWGYANRDSLLITKPGQYVIEAFYNPDENKPIEDLTDCTVSTQIIDYVIQRVSFDDYYGYLCADSKNSTVRGSISVFVKEGSGVPPYSFYLYSGTNDVSGKFIAANNTGVFDDIVSGSARFFVRVEDMCRSSFGIAVPLTPIIISDVIFGDRNVCIGGAAHLSGKMIGTGNQVSYLWTGSNDFSASDRQIVTPALYEPSSYYLEISGIGCKILDSITVTPVDTIHVYYEDIICKGTNYDGGYDFRNPLPTDNLSAGLYHFTSDTLHAQNGGCDSIAHLALRIIDENTVFEDIFAICNNKFPFLWNDTIFEEGTQSGIYTLEKNKNNCSYRLQLNLTVNPAYNDTLPEKIICAGEEILFNGKFYNTSGYYTDYFELSTGCDSLVTLHLTVNPTHRTPLYEFIFEGEDFRKHNFFLPEQTQVGEIRDSVLLQNRHACDSLVVLFLSVLSSGIVAPEGFSPNGDGINDYFVIKNIELYPNNHILIFNRWGNKLYEGKPYMNEWDGRNYFGGNIGTDILPAGTYFYILDLGDGSKVKKGFVYLTR